MTITVKVHVNGNYQATCKTTVDGQPYGEDIVIGPQEEKQLPHQHGKTNFYEVTEEYLGDKRVDTDAKPA
jgi:hypothetical protein